jgi:hypothetical protein
VGVVPSSAMDVDGQTPQIDRICGQSLSIRRDNMSLDRPVENGIGNTGRSSIVSQTT